MSKLINILGQYQAKLFTLNIIAKNRKDNFAVQKEFLDSLKEPKDDLERMILKNRIQLRHTSFIKVFFNIISYIILPFFLLYVSLRRKPKKIEKTDILYLDCVNLNEVKPVALEEEFPDYKIISYNHNFLLLRSDLKIIFKAIFKYKCPGWLLLRFTMKLSFYRYLIEKYHPKSIAITNELSPTSTGLTFFCEQNNVEHINFMHGEKFYSLEESFVHFHRFYVFDEHYKNNFLSLKASDNTLFIIHTPPNFIINTDRYRKEDNMTDFTYYLSGYSEEEFIGISNIIEKLQKSGYTIKIRPHPRFNNYKLMNKFIPEEIIEDPNTISIEESISSCRHGMSVYSSVLYKCVINNIPIVIDDINYKEEFESLKDKKYIIFSKPFQLLSDII
ncbi:MAG: hypothetical protein LBP67_09275 [Bacteroidales bacterium]|jgi:hypothetical protein|nr:hypothetical protein [Bacteroidales bacterium]